MSVWPVLTIGVLAGLALGSYAVTAGLRLSRAEGSTLGRSRCDSCGRSLSFGHTIPLVSYVGLRGACAHCGSRIDPIHIVGEVAGVAVIAPVLWIVDPWRQIPLAVLGLALVATATVDARTRRLPDLFAVIIAVAALALAALAGRPALIAGIVAAALAAAVLVLIRTIALRAKGDAGLGLGDVKLIAALALWLGPATPIMVAAAAILGLVATTVTPRADRRRPFGPFIAVGAWAVGLMAEGGWTPWAP